MAVKCIVLFQCLQAETRPAPLLSVYPVILWVPLLSVLIWGQSEGLAQKLTTMCGWSWETEGQDKIIISE